MYSRVDASNVLLPHRRSAAVHLAVQCTSKALPPEAVRTTLGQSSAQTTMLTNQDTAYRPALGCVHVSHELDYPGYHAWAPLRKELCFARAILLQVLVQLTSHIHGRYKEVREG